MKVYRYGRQAQGHDYSWGSRDVINFSGRGTLNLDTVIRLN